MSLLVVGLSHRSAPVSVLVINENEREHDITEPVCKFLAAKIKTDEIASVIKQEIEQYAAQLEVSEVGRVVEVGDGIARIYGLSNAMAGELLEFQSSEGSVMGQVFAATMVLDYYTGLAREFAFEERRAGVLSREIDERDHRPGTPDAEPTPLKLWPRPKGPPTPSR